MNDYSQKLYAIKIFYLGFKINNASKDLRAIKDKIKEVISSLASKKTIDKVVLSSFFYLLLAELETDFTKKLEYRRLAQELSKSKEIMIYDYYMKIKQQSGTTHKAYGLATGYITQERETLTKHYPLMLNDDIGMGTEYPAFEALNIDIESLSDYDSAFIFDYTLKDFFDIASMRE